MARIVLVADDSPTIQKQALAILKGEGFEVETVSNGVAAIKRLAALEPVVILADVSMPGRDGYEVCDFVKKSAEHCHVPVLLVASNMEPYDDARGAEVRADGIIKKPFEPQELISTVTKFAEQYEASVPALSEPVAEPPVAPEPVPEFAISSEEPVEMPAAGQPPTPDFSAASEGIAFAEPTAEEAPGYSPPPPPPEMEAPAAAPAVEEEVAWEPSPAPEFVETPAAPEAAVAPAEEVPMVVEEPPPPVPEVAPPPPPSPPRPSSFLAGLEEAAPEPVFIEEQAAQPAEPPSPPAEMRTMIFRAPLEIAEPVWKDETVAAAPEPPVAEEAPVPSPEVPAEQPVPPPPGLPSVAATSLDSFSLDDAAAGQVHFALEMPEAGALEVPAPEMAAPEVVAPEVAPPEVVFPAPVSEAVEAAPVTPAAEPVLVESALPESVPEPLTAEPLAAVAPALPAFDWELIYSVVHKVVVRMAPPALSPEAVEDIARRLANEIALELTSGSAQPPV